MLCKNTYSVLIVSGGGGGEKLRSILDRHSFDPVSTASGANEARRAMLTGSYDLVIINTPLSDEFGHELALQVAETAPLGAVLLVKNELFDEVSSRVEEYGVLTLAKPLSPQLFHQAARILIAAGSRRLAVEQENRRLQQKLEETRLVARAKCLLVEYLHLNEEQAHKYIERQAMDMRQSRKAVAESVIKTYTA